MLILCLSCFFYASSFLKQEQKQNKQKLMKIKLEEKSEQPLLGMCEKLVCTSEVGERKRFPGLFSSYINVSIIWISIYFGIQIIMGRKVVANL